MTMTMAHVAMAGKQEKEKRFFGANCELELRQKKQGTRAGVVVLGGLCTCMPHGRVICLYGHYTITHRQYGRLLTSLISRVIAHCTL
jgi:hypothetical protein